MKKQLFFDCDFYSHFAALTDEQAGKIIKAVFGFKQNLTETNFNDRFMDSYWQLTKQKIELQSSLYDKRSFTSAKNGKHGGRPKKPKKPISKQQILLSLQLIDEEIMRRQKLKNDSNEFDI